MQTPGVNDTSSKTRDLDLLDRYWRAANYLSVGQIYLLANPLLREPLLPEHIKPRLLGTLGNHAGGSISSTPISTGSSAPPI